MFALNKKTKTIDGKIVIPYSIDGGKVYCFDSKNKTIVLDLNDFDFTINEEMKEVFVKPLNVEVIKEPIEVTDELFEEEIVEDSFYEEEVSKDNNTGYVPDEEYV